MQENKENQSDIKINELLHNFKKNLEDAKSEHRKVMTNVGKWRSTYYGMPYGNENPERSVIVTKDIRKQSQWKHSAIADPFLSSTNLIKANPVTAEDALAAKQNELLLNTQFCRKFDRFNFIRKAIQLLDRDGTLIVKTGWKYRFKKEVVEIDNIEIDEFGNNFINGKIKIEKEVPIKNQPTAEICRIEDVFIDPTCQGNINNCQFIIYRYETDLNSLNQDGRYKNLNKIKKMENGDEDYDYTKEGDENFKFEDDLRKKLVVYEYWGNYDIKGDGQTKPIVCSWVNDTVIQLIENPMPDKELPFVITTYNSVPFHIYGEPDAELTDDNQRIKTALTRGIIDSVSQSTNGQIGIKKGELDKKQLENLIKGKNFIYNFSPGNIWQGKFNPIPPSVLQVLEMQNNEIESMTGQKSFSSGLNGASLGSTATGARGVMDATGIRKLDQIRNVSENLIKKIIRKWIAYNSEFLDDSEIVRITNNEYVPIRKDDLKGEIDIQIDVTTAEDNDAKAKELAFMLQTIGPNEDPGIRKLILAELMNLMKMPEVAEKITNYQPQPNQTEEQLKQLELEKLRLENEKLKADIADKYARAGENTVDKELKQAKAEVEKAKVRQLNSTADKIDLEFLKENEGIKHKEEMEKEELRRIANLDSMAFQVMHNDKNIGQRRK